MSRCEWCSSHVRIRWAFTKSGKRIPIEVDPNPAGNVELVDVSGSAPRAIVHGGPPGMFDDWTAYMPHHSSCERDLVDE